MTDNAADRVARFVDDLIHGRRPRRFAASPEEAEAMKAAAGLVAGRVGADIPETAALDRIHRRLSEALDEGPRVAPGFALSARRLRPSSSELDWTRWFRIGHRAAQAEAERPLCSCRTTAHGGRSLR